MKLSLALAVFLGAGLGAVLRWALGLWLNGLSNTVPLGTLSANLLGGALIGLALAAFESAPVQQALGEQLPVMRLLLVTGFLGGLTTFSTFSAEVVEAALAGRWGAAALTAGLHLMGSLALTFLGYIAAKSLLGS